MRTNGILLRQPLKKCCFLTSFKAVCRVITNEQNMDKVDMEFPKKFKIILISYFLIETLLI